MNPDKPKISYFLYARKSSESEDRQVQSIEDQIDRTKQLAKSLNLKVIEVFTEAKSAKKPNNRPEFERIIERVENGEANGILCWQINRLSRNPVDSGKIQWMLQQGILQSVMTIDREYLPDDNALLFSVESGIANQFIIDLKKNTRRGILGKIGRGWFPGLAPIGYLNDKEEKTIIVDDHYFPLIRKIWDMMLTGSYTPPKILEIIVRDWGFRTRKFKRKGGGVPNKSWIYKLLTNPFYSGMIVYGDEECEGKHKPMITLAEYDRVQTLLGRDGRPRPKTHEFAYTGLIRCGECGCLYTAEEKTKYIKSTSEARTYVYYHCTRKKTHVKCTQRKYINEITLERQMLAEIDKYTILPEFRDWALEILREANDEEITNRTQINQMQQQTLNDSQSQLDNLTKMRMRDLITDDEYVKERKALAEQIQQSRLRLKETENRADNWLELTEKTFDFVTYARKAFLTGDLQTKKQIVMALGQNPTIKDLKLSIPANKWLVPISEHYPRLEKSYLGLELEKTMDTKDKKKALHDIRTVWGE